VNGVSAWGQRVVEIERHRIAIAAPSLIKPGIHRYRRAAVESDFDLSHRAIDRPIRKQNARAIDLEVEGAAGRGTFQTWILTRGAVVGFGGPATIAGRGEASAILKADGLKGIAEKIVLGGQQSFRGGAGGKIGESGFEGRREELCDVGVAGIVGMDTVGAQVGPGEAAGQKFGIYCVVIADHRHGVIGADGGLPRLRAEARRLVLHEEKQHQRRIVRIAEYLSDEAFVGFAEIGEAATNVVDGKLDDHEVGFFGEHVALDTECAVVGAGGTDAGVDQGGRAFGECLGPPRLHQIRPAVARGRGRSAFGDRATDNCYRDRRAGATLGEEPLQQGLVSGNQLRASDHRTGGRGWRRAGDGRGCGSDRRVLVGTDVRDAVRRNGSLQEIPVVAGRGAGIHGCTTRAEAKILTIGIDELGISQLLRGGERPVCSDDAVAGKLDDIVVVDEA